MTSKTCRSTSRCDASGSGTYLPSADSDDRHERGSEERTTFKTKGIVGQFSATGCGQASESDIAATRVPGLQSERCLPLQHQEVLTFAGLRRDNEAHEPN